MSNKVLCTGGTGFIGFWVAGYCSDKFETTVLDHRFYDTFDWNNGTGITSSTLRPCQLIG